MREYYLPSDIRSADTIAVEKFSVPSVVLMENAAKNAAAEAVKLAGGTKKCFLALAGRGNNGGDAFAAVRHLLLAGCEETVIVKTVSDESYSCDAKVNLDILRRMAGNFSGNLKICDSANLNDDDIFSLCKNADCIIDGLLGTGASGAPRGETGRIIGLLKSFANVLSLDIPSGIDALTGTVYEPSVKADVTSTFLAPKFGTAFVPARDYCGEVKVHDIGVPKNLLLPERPALMEFERSDLHDMIPPLSRDIHKTNRGNLLIIAGSETYRGAPLLTALGALRAGAGIVYLAVPDVIAPYISAELPEAIVIPLPTICGDVDCQASEKEVLSIIAKCGAVAAGPGCGRSSGVDKLFDLLWDKCDKPLLLDADMLWFYSLKKEKIRPRRDVILTPHSAEAGRILEIAYEDVDASRAESAKKLAERVGCALLKGRNTLIASPDNELFMIGAGSPALAVPGSGDVLSGVIGAFIAGGKSDIKRAAAAGALAHAAAGENLERRYGTRGALAREIADEIPFVLGR